MKWDNLRDFISEEMRCEQQEWETLCNTSLEELKKDERAVVGRCDRKILIQCSVTVIPTMLYLILMGV